MMKQEQSIIEPTDVDVLCGRGGLSNNHPGNAWYRRIIASIRPIYRSCPKFSKITLSKAIAELIIKEGGRFLERAPHEESWCVVSYKKAVSKTSQALRGKSNDNDNGEANVNFIPLMTVLSATSGSSQKISKAEMNTIINLITSFVQSTPGDSLKQSSTQSQEERRSLQTKTDEEDSQISILKDSLPINGLLYCNRSSANRDERLTAIVDTHENSSEKINRCQEFSLMSANNMFPHSLSAANGVPLSFPTNALSTGLTPLGIALLTASYNAKPEWKMPHDVGTLSMSHPLSTITSRLFLCKQGFFI